MCALRTCGVRSSFTTRGRQLCVYSTPHKTAVHFVVRVPSHPSIHLIMHSVPLHWCKYVRASLLPSHGGKFYLLYSKANPHWQLTTFTTTNQKHALNNFKMDLSRDSTHHLIHSHLQIFILFTRQYPSVHAYTDDSYDIFLPIPFVLYLFEYFKLLCANIAAPSQYDPYVIRYSPLPTIK